MLTGSTPSDAAVSTATPGHGLRWHQMVFLAMGVPGTVFTLFGYTLGRVGTVPAVALWTLAGIFALVQNLLWLRLAKALGFRNGGLALFAAEAWKARVPLVAPAASMGYWLAWVVTPAVMAQIAAAFIIERWFPGLDLTLGFAGFQLHMTNLLAIGIVVVFAIANLRGVEALSGFAYLSGISLLVPIGLCLAAPFVVPDWSLSARLVQPLAVLDPTTQAQALLAWMFMVCASAYASEMVVTFAGEYRAPRDMSTAAVAISLFSIVVFSLVPLSMAGMIDSAAFASNPAGAFVHLFAGLTSFGYAADAVVIILVANMLVATNGAVADSARGLWSNAKEGFVPKTLGRLNRHGVPGRAIMFGLLLDVVLLATDTSPVGMVATGTIGYMTATVLSLSAFLILKPAGAGRFWRLAAVSLLVVNLVIFVVGVYSFSLTGYGGPREAIIGFLILLSSVVFFVLRRKRGMVED